MCCKSIDITAKTGSDSAVISVRQNELISNFRVLVAVRFEQAINFVVLVFAGQVLRDVGTIDSHGIISGVTVHVIFRQLMKSATTTDAATDTCNTSTSSCPPANGRFWMMKGGDMFKTLFENPGALRDMLQSDKRIKNMIDEHACFGHFLSSDRNLRELFSTIFNPAKVQELGRKRDMHIMRMEWVPGGYNLLGKLNYFMRQAHEDTVAMHYQQLPKCCCKRSKDNPQRGRENKMPLPNPWRQAKPDLKKCALTWNTERVVADLTKLNELAEKTRRQLSIRVRERRSFNFQTESNTSPAATSAGSASPATSVATSPATVASLNIFDFMSSNDGRWEQHYRPQLIELTTLGHTDRQRNICALLMSAGDVQTAIKLLEQWNR